MSQQRNKDTNPWWKTGVVYEIYPRSFQDSDGDGVGDLAGITSRLNYLSWLGVDAVWLTPFYSSPMKDFGYDVAGYTDVDPLFGDLAVFDELVEQAHERNLKIIVDFVPNHSSSEHPWFKESRSSRDNPKRDWYIWRDPKSDGSPPNNWVSMFGGPAWEWDEATEQYYLHSFLKEQPDLNWRNPELKEEMFDAARFWLDRGVDGLRIDMAHAIMKDPELRDNPPNPDPEAGLHKAMGDYDLQLHVHDLDHPDVHNIYRELRAFLDSYGDNGNSRMAMGEMHIFDWARWATYYGENLDELHMPLNFGLLNVSWTAADVRSVVDDVEVALPDGAWPNWVLGNHDEQRVASRVGPAQARVAMMLLLTLRGTPTLYSGEELGMENVPVPPESAQDPWGKNLPELGLGRDPYRTPMQWDTDPNAGFSAPNVDPWLPIAERYEQTNVAVESEDSASMLSLTRALLELRRTATSLAIGNYEPLVGIPEDCLVYVRHYGTERYLVALNFSHEERDLNLPHSGEGNIVVSTYLDREGHVDLEALHLRGDEGCVLRISDS